MYDERVTQIVMVLQETYLLNALLCHSSSVSGGDVAQLVRASDRHAADAGSIPRCGQGIFLPESTFSADSLTMSIHPRVQSHALTSVRTLKIL